MKVEQLLRDKLKAPNRILIPVSLIENGGAPSLIGFLRNTIAMDLLVIEDKVPSWHEIKGKHHIDRYQKLTQWQHGIDLPNWKAYLEGEQQTGIEGWLHFYTVYPGPQAEADPVHLWQRLQVLKQHVQCKSESHTTFRNGTAYFPIDVFRCRRLSAMITVPDIPRVSHPWTQPSKSGVAPKWDIIERDRSWRE